MSFEEEQVLAEMTPEVVSDQFVHSVADCLATSYHEHIGELVGTLVPADMALLLDRLPEDKRIQLIDYLRPRFDPEILLNLEQPILESVIDQLGIAYLASVLPSLSSDDAFDLIESLDTKKQRSLLSAIPRENRLNFERISAYPEDSAARLMQDEVVVVPSFWTVAAVVNYIQNAEALPEEFYEIYLINPRHEPVGKLALKQLLRHLPQTPISSIMDNEIRAIPILTDQEEVAYLFRHYDLVSAPVVDENGRIVGMITADDVVDVMEEESEREIMQLTGVDSGMFNAPILLTSYYRMAGLMVTFLNSFVLAIVVYYFEHIIEKKVILVALMPIVAGMSGASGTQVVAVTVRALSNKLVRSGNAFRTIWKEVVVGFANGVFFSVLLMAILMFWFQDWTLGFILMASLIFNMTWAALGGSALPILVDRLGLDPAISTGPVLTAATDVLGFVTLLALASIFL